MRLLTVAQYPVLRHAYWVKEVPNEFKYTLKLGIHNFKVR